MTRILRVGRQTVHPCQPRFAQRRKGAKKWGKQGWAVLCPTRKIKPVFVSLRVFASSRESGLAGIDGFFSHTPKIFFLFVVFVFEKRKKGRCKSTRKKKKKKSFFFFLKKK